MEIRRDPRFDSTELSSIKNTTSISRYFNKSKWTGEGSVHGKMDALEEEGDTAVESEPELEQCSTSTVPSGLSDAEWISVFV